MDTLFDKLLNAVNKLNSASSGTLDEIRQCKKEIGKLRDDMYDQFASGYYIRDNDRIIISAPTIIIGNVDKSGCVINQSEIILRGNNISLQGVGNGGTIETRADKISIMAEDAGPDGKESAVHNSSNISILGRNVGIESNDSSGTFSHKMKAAAAGLSLHSDTSITLESSLRRDDTESELTTTLADLDAEIGRLEGLAGAKKGELQGMLAKLKGMFKLDEPMHESEAMTYISALLIDNMSDAIANEARKFLQGLTLYLDAVTQLAENKRKKTALKAQKDSLPANLAAQPNGCNINVVGERISIACVDGNNHVRTDKESGVVINTPHTTIASIGDDKRNIPESDFKLQTQNIVLDTTNVKDADKDKKTEEAEYEADGKVKILSKDVAIQTINYKQKDNDPYHCEALCPKGSLSIGVAKLQANTTNEKGEAVGEIKLNSKTINVQSADVDDKGKEKAVAKGSAVVVLSENFRVGGTDDKTKAANIQLTAKETVLHGKDKIWIEQGDKLEGVLSIQQDELELSGKEVTLYGKISTHEINVDALTAKKITSDSVDVKKALTAPQGKWGQGVVQEGSAGKPKATSELKDVTLTPSNK